MATRERLLAATVAACVEHGFEGTTVADIARRAGVSAPAIYNHFGGKVELLVAAGRWGLDQVRPADGTPLTPEGAARAFLAGSFADTRCLLVELHLAGRPAQPRAGRAVELAALADRRLQPEHVRVGPRDLSCVSARSGLMIATPRSSPLGPTMSTVSRVTYCPFCVTSRRLVSS